MISSRSRSITTCEFFVAPRLIHSSYQLYKNVVATTRSRIAHQQQVAVCAGLARFHVANRWQKGPISPSKVLRAKVLALVSRSWPCHFPYRAPRFASCSCVPPHRLISNPVQGAPKKLHRRSRTRRLSIRPLPTHHQLAAYPRLPLNSKFHSSS